MPSGLPVPGGSGHSPYLAALAAAFAAAAGPPTPGERVAMSEGLFQNPLFYPLCGPEQQALPASPPMPGMAPAPPGRTPAPPAPAGAGTGRCEPWQIRQEGHKQAQLGPVAPVPGTGIDRSSSAGWGCFLIQPLSVPFYTGKSPLIAATY